MSTHENLNPEGKYTFFDENAILIWRVRHANEDFAKMVNQFGGYDGTNVTLDEIKYYLETLSVALSNPKSVVPEAKGMPPHLKEYVLLNELQKVVEFREQIIKIGPQSDREQIADAKKFFDLLGRSEEKRPIGRSIRFVSNLEANQRLTRAYACAVEVLENIIQEENS